MLVEILKEPKNAILKQYQKLLAMDEVKLEFEEGAPLFPAVRRVWQPEGVCACRISAVGFRREKLVCFAESGARLPGVCPERFDEAAGA